MVSTAAPEARVLPRWSRTTRRWRGGVDDEGSREAARPITTNEDARGLAACRRLTEHARPSRTAVPEVAHLLRQPPSRVNYQTSRLGCGRGGGRHAGRAERLDRRWRTLWCGCCWSSCWSSCYSRRCRRRPTEPCADTCRHLGRHPKRSGSLQARTPDGSISPATAGRPRHTRRGRGSRGKSSRGAAKASNPSEHSDDDGALRAARILGDLVDGVVVSRRGPGSSPTC